jgi:hypothetical protein
MKKLFEVVSCNPTKNSKEPGFCIKLKTSVTMDIGGEESYLWTTTRYYYLFNTTEIAIGAKLPIKLSACDIVPRKHETEDGKELTLNFLYIKGQ